MKDIGDLKIDAEIALRRAMEIQDAAKAADRLPTAEEKAEIAANVKKADDCQAQIKEIREAEQLEASLKEKYQDFRNPGKRQTDSPERPDQTAEFRDNRIEVRSKVPAHMRVFRNSGKARQHDEEMAYKFGCFVAATVGGAGWAKRRMRDFANNDRGINDAYRVMTESSNTAGGYTVPDEMSNYIIRIVEDYSVFAREAFVQNMSRDVMNIPRRTAGLTVYNTAENTAPTASTMAFDMVQLTANKAGVLTSYSSELAEDSAIDIAEQVGLEIGQAMGQKIDTCGFLGDGTNGNFGITGLVTKIEALDNTYWCQQRLVPINSFAEITAASLGKVSGAVMGSVKQAGNCKYFISPQGFDAGIGAVLAGLGGVTMTEGSNARPMRYNGYDVVQAAVLREESSGSITDDQVMLLFGDLRKSSTMGLRRELQIASSREFYFSQDAVAVTGFMRFDIVNHDVGGLIATGADAKTPMAALLADAA